MDTGVWNGNSSHVLAEPTYKEEGGGPGHVRKTINEEVEPNFPESIISTSTISAFFSHRSTHTTHVTVCPLLPHDYNERDEERRHETRVHERSSGDDPTKRVFLYRWNGGNFILDCGLIEGEEDYAKGVRRLLICVWFEFRVDSGDELMAEDRPAQRRSKTSDGGKRQTTEKTGRDEDRHAEGDLSTLLNIFLFSMRRRGSSRRGRYSVVEGLDTNKTGNLNQPGSEMQRTKDRKGCRLYR